MKGNMALFWILAVSELEAAEFSILQNTEMHSSLNTFIFSIISIYSFLFFYFLLLQSYGLLKELRATLNLSNASNAKHIQLSFLTLRQNFFF